MMNINLTSPNPALESIFNDPNQVITLDANFLIPPNRPRVRAFDFNIFQQYWLEPIFEAFPNLAIHKAVYDELILPDIKTYVEGKINGTPPRLAIHNDSSLTPIEIMLRDSIEEKISPLTNYNPVLDNKDDRGEVKSLAYIAVKGLLYFAAHDYNVIQLIEKAEEWSTGLDNVQAIKMYELIFYLYKMNMSNNKSLRMLYKYQYHLTHHEKSANPEWSQYIETMEAFYHC